jgi:transmembrane sensor
MTIPPDKLRQLYDLWTAKKAGSEELMQILEAGSEEELEKILNPLMKEREASITDTGKFTAEQQDKLVSYILSAYSATKQAPVHHLKTTLLKYAAAIIIIAGIGGYLWKTKLKEPAPAVVAIAERMDVVAPGKVRAMLTLTDGRQINLDSISNGVLAVQGNTKIEKLNDGSIVYKGASGGELLFNTIAVPRGSKIASLKLSDGTMVYLNSASSLKYPVAFTGKERKVEITGEAYFEVAKDPTKKFMVVADGLTTEVLGTHFNINTFNDETARRVTLLEGSIKVVQAKNEVIIKPGDQAVVQGGNIAINRSADLGQVMAWKNGAFNFNNADFQSAMRQISRWYDIEVKYKSTVPVFDFQGELPRTYTLNQVLRALQKVGVKFELKERTLIVSP